MKKFHYTIRVGILIICSTAYLCSGAQSQPTNSSGKLLVASGKAKSVSSAVLAKTNNDDPSPLAKVLKQSNVVRPYIYPNPVKDILSVKAISNQANLKVISVLGNVMAQYNRQNTIDVTLLPNGIYYLKIEDQGVMNVLRFIKQ